MADFDIRSKSGEQFSIGGQITKPAAVNDPPPFPPYPAVAAGYAVNFTAKRSPSDTTAVVTRAGTLQNGGAWSVAIVASDTSGFTKAEELAYDVVLTEPDGTKTVVCAGTWEIGKSVGL